MKYPFRKYIQYHRRHINQHPYVKLFTHSPFSISSTWTGIVFSYIEKITVANLSWTLRSLLPPAPELRPSVDSVTLSSRRIGVDGSDDRRRSSGITTRACRNVLTTSGLILSICWTPRRDFWSSIPSHIIPEYLHVMCVCIHLCTRLLRSNRAGLANIILCISVFVCIYMFTIFYLQIKCIIIFLTLLSYNV